MTRGRPIEVVFRASCLDGSSGVRIFGRELDARIWLKSRYVHDARGIDALGALSDRLPRGWSSSGALSTDIGRAVSAGIPVDRVLEAANDGVAVFLAELAGRQDVQAELWSEAPPSGSFALPDPIIPALSRALREQRHPDSVALDMRGRWHDIVVSSVEDPEHVAEVDTIAVRTLALLDRPMSLGELIERGGRRQDERTRHAWRAVDLLMLFGLIRFDRRVQQKAQAPRVTDPPLPPTRGEAGPWRPAQEPEQVSGWRPTPEPAQVSFEDDEDEIALDEGSSYNTDASSDVLAGLPDDEEPSVATMGEEPESSVDLEGEYVPAQSLHSRLSQGLDPMASGRQSARVELDRLRRLMADVAPLVIADLEPQQAMGLLSRDEVAEAFERGLERLRQNRMMDAPKSIREGVQELERLALSHAPGLRDPAVIAGWLKAVRARLPELRRPTESQKGEAADYFAVAQRLVKDRDIDGALRNARRAIHLDPGPGRYRVLEVFCLVASRRMSAGDAVMNLDALSIAEARDRAVAQLTAARIFKALNRVPEARARYEAALREDPGKEEARRELAALKG